MSEPSSINPEPSPSASGNEAPTGHLDVEILSGIPAKFAIHDDASANWLVRRVISARAYSDRVKTWAEAEVARAAREERTLMFLFGRQIEAWAKEEIDKLNGQRKSIALPAGTVGFRTLKATLQIDDEPSVVSWAKENCPAAVVVTEKLSRSVLKEHFESSGQIPDDGAHVEPATEKFFVR